MTSELAGNHVSDCDGMNAVSIATALFTDFRQWHPFNADHAQEVPLSIKE
ncbi:hypothetical protein [Acidovorax sp. NCPPB 3576]|nr:hypothetical protein [Acidovorax sp. NCPPB 3576]WCM86809.1 hypothetical protein M5C98_15670 [Acidovorax sp. NCPPB 3576]